MTTWIRTALLAGALAVAAGCSKAEETKPPAPEAAKPAAPAEPRLTDEELPIEADFEEQADQEITAATYKAELDSLAGEIEASD